MSTPPKEDRTIVLDFASEEQYQALLDNIQEYREFLQQQFLQHPELFPPYFEQGFRFHGFRTSTKQAGFRVRRILIPSTGHAYAIRPSFMLSYMRGKTDDVEKALYLCKYGVPFSALTYSFGRNDMFWYRLYTSLGRPSVVGTTVKKETPIPAHLLADEKHTRWNKEKAYVATTVGGGCILGASLAFAADADSLKEAYGVFAQEAQEQDPDYQPETVNTDGWQATQNAWEWLFDKVTVILCFLHAWLSIRKRCKKDKELQHEIGDRVWEAYRAETRASFSQRIRRLHEWATEHITKKWVLKKVLALCEKKDAFLEAFEHPECHRTSNGLDRLMDYQDRVLYSMRYFHGHQDSSNLYLRTSALIYNFHPLTPRALQDGEDQQTSPFERLNGFRYHRNWLQNLLIASSVGGKSQHQIR